MTIPQADRLGEAMRLLRTASHADLLELVKRFDADNRVNITPRIEYKDLMYVAARAVREYHDMIFGKPASYHFKVPNNFIGRAIIWLLKRYMNKDYKFVAWGREPKFKGARRNRFGTRLPLEHANAIVLYIRCKKARGD